MASRVLPMTMTRLLAALALLFVAPDVGAQAGRPLLVEGTSTVFQRVLTRPGTSWRDGPQGRELGLYPAFQPLYVFAREGEWLNVGGAANMPAQGWVSEDAVIAWRHNVVAAFANPAGRERQLLFGDLASLDRLLYHERAVTMARGYREAVEGGHPPEGSGVVSVEPDVYIDINDPDTFYILPILEFTEDFHPMTAELFLKMRVASVSLREAPPDDGRTAEELLRESDAGIVIALDSTQSMEPFIEETLEVVRMSVSRIKGSAIGDRVHFGIIGFRDNPEAVDGLGYRVRVFAPLDREAASSAPLEALAGMEVAAVSSPGYNEDSFAAVRHAIETTDWTPGGRPFVRKLVIVVTDAGPKPSGDPNAESDITAAALRAMAHEAGIGIIVIHLLSPDGIANHEYAAAQYRELAAAFGHVFYYPVTGGRDEFGDQIGTTIGRVMSQVEANLEGALTEVPGPDESGELPQGAELDVLGLAMELAYLGETQDARAPDVFEAWIADRALEDSRKVAVAPRLLVTKNQLSSLRDVLAAVLEIGESTQGSGTSGEFFSQLQGSVARMATDPTMLFNTEFDTLGSAFGEFLEGLPYQSRVMEITEDRWENMGTGRRQIIDDLRGRFLLYERWHDDPDLWVPLYENAPDGEHVYAMPFGALP